MKEIDYKIGDKVHVKLMSKHRRVGVILNLPDIEHAFYPECYQIEFASGSRSFLTADEFKPLDAVERLAKLADDEA